MLVWFVTPNYKTFCASFTNLEKTIAAILKRLRQVLLKVLKSVLTLGVLKKKYAKYLYGSGRLE